jgi:hypothetical protein
MWDKDVWTKGKTPPPREWTDVQVLPRYKDVFDVPEPQTPYQSGLRLAAGVGAPDPTDIPRLTATLAGRLGRMPARAAAKGMMDPMAATQAERAAWHGSPHTWGAAPGAPLGKVDLSKVGTGEGAQAYGWGFYAAESPETGKFYKDVLEVKDMTIDGKVVKPKEHGIDKIVARTPDDKTLKEELINYTKEKADNPYADTETASAIVNAIDAGTFKRGAPGTLYELDIPDEAIDKMLDWDKPLSGHSKETQDALKRAGLEIDEHPHQVSVIGDGPDGYMNDHYLLDNASEAQEFKAEMAGKGYSAEYLGQTESYRPRTGEEIYNTAKEKIIRGELWPDAPSDVEADKLASLYLNKHGIPGIKYLDQASRDVGKGTRNFVLFDEGTAKVVGRDGEKISPHRVEGMQTGVGGWLQDVAGLGTPGEVSDVITKMYTDPDAMITIRGKQVRAGDLKQEYTHDIVTGAYSD